MIRLGMAVLRSQAPIGVSTPPLKYCTCSAASWGSRRLNRTQIKGSASTSRQNCTNSSRPAPGRLKPAPGAERPALVGVADRVAPLEFAQVGVVERAAAEPDDPRAAVALTASTTSAPPAALLRSRARATHCQARAFPVRETRSSSVALDVRLAEGTSRRAQLAASRRSASNSARRVDGPFAVQPTRTGPLIPALLQVST